MGKEKQIEDAELKTENGKEEKARMDMPTVPPPSLDETGDPPLPKEKQGRPPVKNSKHKKKKKARPRKFDFSMNGRIAGRMCPNCGHWNTRQINTVKNIQYRECLNQSCAGNPREGNKKTYKVVGVEI